MSDLPILQIPQIRCLSPHPYHQQSIDILQNYIINHTVQLQLKDNRIYYGTVYCIDGDRNIILNNVRWLYRDQLVNVPHCLFNLHYIQSIQLLNENQDKKKVVESEINEYNQLIKP